MLTIKPWAQRTIIVSGAFICGLAGKAAFAAPVPEPPVHVETLKQEIEENRVDLSSASKQLREAPGIWLTGQALDLRYQELTQALGQINGARDSLSHVNGLESDLAQVAATLAQPLAKGTPAAPAPLPALKASLRNLAEAMQQLQFSDAQSQSFGLVSPQPPKPSVVDGYFAKALDALKSASDVATAVGVQEQAIAAALASMRNGVLSRPSADPAQAKYNSQQAALIATLSDRVSGDLTKAAATLLTPPASKASQSVAATARKLALLKVGYAAKAQAQVTTTLSWANGGELAYDPADSDALIAALGNALKSLAAAGQEWTGVGAEQTSDPVLVTSGARDTVAALGALGDAEDRLKILAAKAPASGPKTCPPNTMMCVDRNVPLGCHLGPNPIGPDGCPIYCSQPLICPGNTAP